MNDMSGVIVPRSDQINADSLLSGPITITITRVEIKAGTEQPVTIFYEGDDGKPWRPCKSMARVLVAAWGPDASKYKGRSLTLYCDPKVRWGGMEVGGIRISHMSDIPESLTMALTVTRANKKPFTVRPIPAGTPKAAAPAGQSSAPSDQRSQTDERAPAAPLTADDIIKKIERADSADALTEAADLARSLASPADKQRASDAYKSTLAKLRGQKERVAT